MATKAQATPSREVINVPLTRDRDTIEIGVNGKIYQIRCGEDVEVPHKVAVAYRMSQEIEAKAIRANRAMQRDVIRDMDRTLNTYR